MSKRKGGISDLDKDLCESELEDGRKMDRDKPVPADVPITLTEATLLLARDTYRVRRALERIADALELKAVLQAQVSVPDETATKLDGWRDAVLERLAKRELRRRKKKRDPGIGPTRPNLRGEPAEGTFYGEPVESIMNEKI